MKLPTLYQMTDEYLVAFQQLQESDMPPEVVRDTLEGLQYPIEEKSTAIAQMARNMEALADQIKTAREQMLERESLLRKQAERLEGYILENLERAAIQKIECPYFKISVQKNPARVDIDEGALIPDRYLSIPKIPDPKPDKKAIKEALEKGELIQGCKLVRDNRLVIK